MEVIGKIKLIGKTESFGTNNFRKRNLVITTDEQYPQFINIEFIQDKVDILDKYKVNDNIKVGINLRGREWINPQGEAKYFNSIQGWRIDKVEIDNTNLPPVENFTSEPENIGEVSDDLPF